MKNHLALFFIPLFISESAFAGTNAHVLSFPWTKQEQAQWCWDGVATNILKYYGVTVQQCQLADKARTSGWFYTDMGDTDCCENATECNQPNNMGVIGQLVDYYGGIETSNVEYKQASMNEIAKNIDNNRPIIYRWAWYSNGKYTGSAHFLTIYGYDKQTTLINYFDPGYNEGYHVLDYESMKQTSGHNWTHTLFVSTTPDSTCGADKGCCICHTKDGCCDGCRPIINSDGNICSSSNNSCQKSGTCAQGVCTAAIDVDDGTPCTPTDLCASQGQCFSGSCQAIAQKECVSSNPCLEQGVCDSTTGQCKYLMKAEGAACKPADKCAATGSCILGECIISSMKNCLSTDQCHDNGTCNPETGECDFPASIDGKSCSDENSCTLNDTCKNGVCISGTPVVCEAKQCQTVGVCQPDSGICSYSPLENGSPCSDGNPCTEESCYQGTCQVTVSGCDDDNPCTTDTCTANGCTHTKLANGDSCGYGKCGPAYCLEGVCNYDNEAFDTTCNDGDPCTNNRCSNERGCYFTPMKNGESCGENKICQNHKCIDDPAAPASKGCQNGSPNCWLIAGLTLLLSARRRRSA